MFLDELIDPFYKKLGLDYRKNLRCGQICEAPILYAYEHREIWRPSAYDGTETVASDFRIIARPFDAFKLTRTIHTPRLEPYEEFPAIRAKIRPCVLLAPDPAPIHIQEIRGGGKIDRHLCVTVPCYGVVDAMGKAKFPRPFLDRVRKLEFPHFMFLPGSTPLDKDSVLRLDSMQPVFHGELEPTQWMLEEEALKVFLGQVRMFTTGRYSDEYQTVREWLLKGE